MHAHGLGIHQQLETHLPRSKQKAKASCCSRTKAPVFCSPARGYEGDLIIQHDAPGTNLEGRLELEEEKWRRTDREIPVQNDLAAKGRFFVVA